MIEINLSLSKKEQGFGKVGGFDFTKINVKGMIIAIIILYVPEIFLLNYYEEKNAELNSKATELKNKQRSLSNKVKSFDNIQKQITALKEQEAKLEQRLTVVKEIISKRQNPFIVFKYIAENTPTDLWIKELSLNEKLELVIRGESLSWKSIGLFLDNLKNGIFFSKDFSYSQPPLAPQQNVQGGVPKQRFEAFEIRTRLVRFE